MNVPLVRNDVIPNFRSVSPPTRSNKIARERSPQPQTYISSQENLSKNPIVGTSTTNPIQKPTQIESDAFKVYVRVRPLNSKELASNTSKRLSTVEVRDNMVKFINITLLF